MTPAPNDTSGSLPTTPLSRIERVLTYIHDHLDTPLSVASLARHGGWSRWQFQRVFAAHTGLSVAQYVRELRLSRAAEELLTSSQRQLDIALACGFDSEISFSRSFRQMFGCTPRSYRQRGQRTGLKTPIFTGDLPLPPAELNPRMLQIRVESKLAFEVVGVPGQICGLFSTQPDFATKVPALWQALFERVNRSAQVPLIGVLDICHGVEDGSRFSYWAAVEADVVGDIPGLQRLRVPAQEYAVIPFQGPIRALEKTLDWFIHHWLPHSGYRGRYGYDLEVYQPDFNLDTDHVCMEYWVPVVAETRTSSA